MKTANRDSGQEEKRGSLVKAVNSHSAAGNHEMRRASRDLIVISIIAILVLVIGAIFDLHELVDEWLRVTEWADLDELLIVFTFLAIAFSIFSLRRLGEVKSESIEHEKAEKALKESEDKFRSLAEQSPNMIFINSRGGVVYANKKCEEAMGYAREEYYSPDFNFLNLIAPEYRDSMKASLVKHMKGQGQASYEYALITKEGKRIEAILATKLIRYEDEDFAILGTVTDVTERKKAEEDLRETHQKLADWTDELERNTHEMTLLSKMSDLLQTCLTANEAYNIINRFAQELFPAESGALYVLSPSRILEEAVVVWGESPPMERVFTPNECWALRRGQIHIVKESLSGIICPHLGQSLSGMSMCVPVVAQSEALGVLNLQIGQLGTKQLQSQEEEDRVLRSREQLAPAFARHIALTLANLKLQETLRNQAIRDPLTSLFNRRYMEESLARELSRAVRIGLPLGIVMIDIDHFKNFNDTYGHAAGDILLRELGILLQTGIRAEDIASRYGGEEFTLVLPETSLEDTRRRADQLRSEVKHLNLQHKRRQLETVTLSFGVAEFPEHGATVEALLRKADEALYQAKAEGRDKVVVSAFV
jgi:diguanylate cyclase (GGDEF)-like protein/PAS domain S-box-containing protein